MDEAWRLERESWEAVSSGKGSDFYARHMTTDGFMVVPGRIIERHELIMRWKVREPLTEFGLSGPRMLLVDGGSVLIAYSVSAHGSWLPNYSASVTSLYTWIGGRWALVFRQHTPDGEAPFPF